MKLLLMIKHDFDKHHWYDFSTQQTLSAIIVAFVWFDAFYWMRLFYDYAFFINLLTATITDIKAFAIMLIILLVGFANVIYIFSLADPTKECA